MRRTITESFETLLNGCRTKLFRHALRLTRNLEDAEDLFQDTLVKAFKGFHTFRRETNFKNWIFQILINNFFSRRRRDHYPSITVSYDQAPNCCATEDCDANYLDLIAVEEQDPERIVLNKLLQAEYQKALHELPREFRSALLLHDIEQHPYKDIAQLLGIPLGTVRSRIFRGRRIIRQSLGVESNHSQPRR